MPKPFYFTYGYDDPEQAYRGGWTLVMAEDRDKAIAAYRLYHPLTKDQLLPCCSVALTTAEMGNMLLDGNHGHYAHDVITLGREDIDNA